MKRNFFQKWVFSPLEGVPCIFWAKLHYQKIHRASDNPFSIEDNLTRFGPWKFTSSKRRREVRGFRFFKRYFCHLSKPGTGRVNFSCLNNLKPFFMANPCWSYLCTWIHFQWNQVCSYRWTTLLCWYIQHYDHNRLYQAHIRQHL